MRLRMCDEDQQRYGGPEWLDDDVTIEWLNDLDYDALRELEKQIKADPGIVEELGKSANLLSVVGQIIEPTEVAKSAPLLRARVWLALRAAGVDVALAGFTPKIFRARTAGRSADADPPSGGAESSPTSTQPSTTDAPASETSTSASTPGSPDATD